MPIDNADDTAPTRQHEPDHTDHTDHPNHKYICPERSKIMNYENRYISVLGVEVVTQQKNPTKQQNSQVARGRLEGPRKTTPPPAAPAPPRQSRGRTPSVPPPRHKTARPWLTANAPTPPHSPCSSAANRVRWEAGRLQKCKVQIRNR